jgi:hypothetical protein
MSVAAATPDDSPILDHGAATSVWLRDSEGDLLALDEIVGASRTGEAGHDDG